MTLTLFFTTAMASLWMVFRYLNLIQLLRNIPTSKIRSSPQGYTELIGRAKPLDSVDFHAPGSDRRCVWFEYRYLKNPGDTNSITTKATRGSFLIDDGTGVCRVDPVYMRFETRHSTHSIQHPTPVLTSRWIEVGEKIHVYGKFTTLRADYRAQRKEMLLTRLSALKNNRELIQQIDINTDGLIDGEEWERAVRDIEQEIDSQIDQLQNLHHNSPENHILRAPDDKRLPYLVSAHKEPHTVHVFIWYAALWSMIALIALYFFIKGLL